MSAWHSTKPKRRSRRAAPLQRIVRKQPEPITTSITHSLHADKLNPAGMQPTDLLHLQSTIGNQAVQRLLINRGAPTASPPVVQRKFQVGPAGDRFEREADQVARSVGQSSAGKQAPAPTPSIQRQETAQVGPQGGTVDGALASRIQRHKQGGQAVPTGVRRSVEQVTGADLSTVRVHDDAQAQTMSSQLGAKAFTQGNHIFLGSRQSKYDVQLMAHELTHTIQQGATTVQGETGSPAGSPAADKAQTISQIQRKLAKKQKSSFKSRIRKLTRKLDRAIDPEDKAVNQLNAISASLNTIAAAVADSERTDNDAVSQIERMFDSAITLAGLDKGGGYLAPDEIENARNERDVTLQHLTNMSSIYKHKEEFRIPNEIKQNYKIRKGKFRQKQIGFHAGGVAANLMSVPYFLMMHATEGVAKAQGASLLSKLKTVEKSRAYFNPVKTLRQNGQALVTKLTDQPQVEQAYQDLDRMLEKLLKKRKAQVYSGTLSDEKSQAKKLQKRFMMRNFYRNLDKGWGPD